MYILFHNFSFTIFCLFLTIFYFFSFIHSFSLSFLHPSLFMTSFIPHLHLPSDSIIPLTTHSTVDWSKARGCSEREGGHVLDVYDCGCPTTRHHDISYYHNIKVSCCVCVWWYNLINFIQESNFYLFFLIFFYIFFLPYSIFFSNLERNNAVKKDIKEGGRRKEKGKTHIVSVGIFQVL